MTYAGVRVSCRCRIIAIAIAISIIPLTPISWKRIHYAISLVIGIVTIIIFIDICIPKVDALVVSSMSSNDFTAIRMPRNPIDLSTLIVESTCTITRSRAGESIDQQASYGFIDFCRSPIGFKPEESYHKLGTIR